jgi:glucosamine--fructose-6-phosphate aminotransferase (isomerizing)
MTELELAIRSQPAELARLAARDFAGAAARLAARRRVWLVGTGSSQHVAELGAMALALAGVDARPSGSMEFVRSPPPLDRADAVVIISHTGRTSFALAARELAAASGADLLSITGIGAGWPEAIETVAIERSETYTVSVTAAFTVLLRVAGELGARGLAPSELAVAIERVGAVVEQGEVPEMSAPERALVIVGAGAAAVSAREGALKLREAAHVLAEGYAAEYLLHGGAVPLGRRDGVLLLCPSEDRDGLVSALGEAAGAEGLAVASIEERSLEHSLLAQLPINVRLQLLALALSAARATNPDEAIVGRWADDHLWAIGKPHHGSG